MKSKIILLLIAITLINGQAIGNIDPIDDRIEYNMLHTVMEAPMTVEINGAIKLYSILKEDIELIDTEFLHISEKENTSNWQLAYNRNYYIGYSDNKVEAITPSNFKRIAKKYFTNAPELTAIIGKRGFRYKNLPTIILYYNNQVIRGKAIDKEDKLLVQPIIK